MTLTQPNLRTAILTAFIGLAGAAPAAYAQNPCAPKDSRQRGADGVSQPLPANAARVRRRVGQPARMAVDRRRTAGHVDQCAAAPAVRAHRLNIRRRLFSLRRPASALTRA